MKKYKKQGINPLGAALVLAAFLFFAPCVSFAQRDPSLASDQWAQFHGVSDDVLNRVGLFLTNKGEWNSTRDREKIKERSRLFLGRINRTEYKVNPQKALEDALCEARTAAHDLAVGEICGQPAPVQAETPGFISPILVAPNISNGINPVLFRFTLKEEGQVRLRIVAVSGEEVFNQAAFGNKGQNRLVWDVKTKTGQSAASGVYIYVFQIQGLGGKAQVKTGKIVIVR